MASFHKHGKSSDGRRPECKDCSKERLAKRKQNDPYTSQLNSLADNILKRTKYAIDKPKNKTYLERGIKCLIGDSRNQIRDYLDKYYSEEIKAIMESGEKPSVDRVDPYGHYEAGNIQIVTLAENLARVDQSYKSIPIKVTYPNGEETVFDSISDAAKTLVCKRDTIYASLERPGINRKGLLFEYVRKQA